jgi:hypothetical protein
MATTNLTFSATIEKFGKDALAKATAVARQSAQDVRNEMLQERGKGGRMRVDTGFLRKSLMESTSAMPVIDAMARPTALSYSAPPAVSLVIAGWELGQPLYMGFTAAYAAYREYGTSGQPPDAFVRSAAAQWQQIVNRNAARVRKD